MQVVSESGAATRRSRSRGQRCPRVVPRGAQASKRRSAGESPRATAAKAEGFTLGRVAAAQATRCDQLSPDGAGWGCLQATRERQRSASRIGQGSSRRNQPRGVRMQVASNRRKTGLLRELALERARVRSMESVERPATERQGMHRSASYRSWWAVTPPPILPGSGGANHTGLVGKGIDSNRWRVARRGNSGSGRAGPAARGVCSHAHARRERSAGLSSSANTGLKQPRHVEWDMACAAEALWRRLGPERLADADPDGLLHPGPSGLSAMSGSRNGRGRSNDGSR